MIILKEANNRFKHVYCTDCVHWLGLYNNIKFNKPLPRECVTCFSYNPEDGVHLIKRKNYKNKLDSKKERCIMNNKKCKRKNDTKIKRDNKYQVYLTQEEADAIPILLNMAMVYTWELFSKKEHDKFYRQHKENIDMIKKYHEKGYQGILAVGEMIEDKVNKAIKNQMK